MTLSQEAAAKLLSSRKIHEARLAALSVTDAAGVLLGGKAAKREINQVKHLIAQIDKALAAPAKPKGKKRKEHNPDAFQADRVTILQKSEKVQVRVSRGIWKAGEIVDIRNWYRDRSGAFLPSTKGLTIDIGQCEALIGAIRSMTSLEDNQ